LCEYHPWLLGLLLHEDSVLDAADDCQYQVKSLAYVRASQMSREQIRSAIPFRHQSMYLLHWVLLNAYLL
jgi:hypothetical protein